VRHDWFTYIILFSLFKIACIFLYRFQLLWLSSSFKLLSPPSSNLLRYRRLSSIAMPLSPWPVPAYNLLCLYTWYNSADSVLLFQCGCNNEYNMVNQRCPSYSAVVSSGLKPHTSMEYLPLPLLRYCGFVINYCVKFESCVWKHNSYAILIPFS